jgi:hypothetical protein
MVCLLPNLANFNLTHNHFVIRHFGFPPLLMRSRLKSLLVVVTLASIFTGAIAGLIALSKVRPTYAVSETVYAPLFVILSILAALVGAFIGKWFGASRAGAILGIIAALIALIAFYVSMTAIQ